MLKGCKKKKGDIERNDGRRKSLRQKNLSQGIFISKRKEFFKSRESFEKTINLRAAIFEKARN